MPQAISYTEEHALLERVQRGDRQAFGKLYDRYAPALLGLILRIVGEREKAESVLQGAFLIMWEKIKTFEPSKGPLFTWMLSIARSAALEAAADQDTAAEIRRSGSSVSLINPASVKEQQALALIYFKGYSLDKAAAELGCPVEGLRGRIRMELQQTRGATVDE